MSALLIRSLVVVGVAGASGWLWSAARPADRLRSRSRRSRPHVRLPTGRQLDHVVRAVAERPRRLLVTAVGAGVGCAALARSPAPVVLVPLAVWALLRVRRDRARARAATARRQAVAELCSVLAGELLAGRAPAQALSWAGADCGDEELAARLGVGVELAVDSARVPAILDELARLPGAADLRQVAACWRVSEGAGAGLARALGQLAGALRAEQARRVEIAVELAGPRATARLLAALPVFGLLLGSAMGASPLHVLLRTPYGLACLAGGVALTACGLAWTERIVQRAEGVAPTAAGEGRGGAGSPP